MATKETIDGLRQVIRNRAVKDIINPPGQTKYPQNRGTYLRDIIKRIQREEFDEPIKTPQEAIKEVPATIPSTDAEKRLQALLGALAGYLDGSKGAVVSGAQVRNEIRKILSKFT